MNSKYEWGGGQRLYLFNNTNNNNKNFSSRASITYAHALYIFWKTRHEPSLSWISPPEQGGRKISA